jgi:hypothetical protein
MLMADDATMLLDIESEPGQQLAFELGRGRTYQLLFSNRVRFDAALGKISRGSGVGTVMHEGALISNISVRENILLPVAYRDPERLEEASLRAHEIFTAIGFAGAELDALLRRLPAGLSALERRITGFVRALLTNPQVLVFDRLGDDLTPEESRHAETLHRVWWACFPFRTAIYLDFEGRARLACQQPDVCYRLS